MDVFIHVHHWPHIGDFFFFYRKTGQQTVRSTLQLKLQRPMLEDKWVQNSLRHLFLFLTSPWHVLTTWHYLPHQNLRGNPSAQIKQRHCALLLSPSLHFLHTLFLNPFYPALCHFSLFSLPLNAIPGGIQAHPTGILQFRETLHDVLVLLFCMLCHRCW